MDAALATLPTRIDPSGAAANFADSYACQACELMGIPFRATVAHQQAPASSTYGEQLIRFLAEVDGFTFDLITSAVPTLGAADTANDEPAVLACELINERADELLSSAMGLASAIGEAA